MAMYACESCHQTFAADGEPRECPKCGSRLVVPASAAAAPVATDVLGQMGGGLGGSATVPPAPLTPRSAVALGYADPKLLVADGGPMLLWMMVAFAAAIALQLLAAVLAIPATIAAANQRPSGFSVAYAAVAFLVLFPYLTGFVLGMIGLYRGWTAVQPLRAVDPAEANMPTPGKAVGFTFIPFFNFYWVFVAMPGLARRANRLAQDRLGGRPAMNPTLAMAAAVMIVVQVFASCIPVLGLLVQAGTTALLALFFRDCYRVPKALAV